MRTKVLEGVVDRVAYDGGSCARRHQEVTQAERTRRSVAGIYKEECLEANQGLSEAPVELQPRRTVVVAG